ncbi:tyrosine-type recombinase/integrase [Arhodomonas sp. SL1]|uniref:tyrosine-type recombinase/integrase n=1 Tax=Arhodomonas sp. SL1 TaxID=3425691 RepID=UPI003F882A7A
MAGTRHQLTAKAIQQAKPAERAYDLYDGGNGLSLRVNPGGGKSWRLRYKLHGKTEVMTLGTLADLTLAKARERAEEARRLARSGVSPAAEAQRARHERRIMPTVTDFADEYIRLHAKPNKKTWRVDEQILNRWVIPELGKVPLGDLHRRDVVAVIDQVREAGNSRQPGKVLAVFRRMLRFAVERGVIEQSPAVYVTVKQPVGPTRALSHDEVRRWWSGTFDPATGALPARLALRLLLLTGQRGGEVGGLRVEELDLEGGVWHVPGERRKMGHPHRVPLSDAARAVVDQAMAETTADGFLFPNRTETGGVRVDGALRATLRRIFADYERPPGTHDARRVVATELAECLECSEEAIAAVLGHQPKTVTASYIKRRERMARAPLHAWASHLAELTGEVGSAQWDNVVALSGDPASR